MFCASCSNFRFDVSVFCASCSNFRFDVSVFCASCSNFCFDVSVFCASCSNLRHVCSDVGCHITMKILNIAVPNCMEYRPNPQPLPFKGRGVRFKASLLLGERSKLYCTQARTTIGLLYYSSSSNCSIYFCTKGTWKALPS